MVEISLGTRRGVLAVLVSAVVLAMASRFNPFMSSAVNNRLEAPCADPENARAVEVDRDAWTPLLWSCTVERLDGSTETVRPW